MKLVETYPGAQEVVVRHGGLDLFVLSGASMDMLDLKKIKEYVDGVDWADAKSKAYVPARLYCDDFRKSHGFMKEED